MNPRTLKRYTIPGPAGALEIAMNFPPPPHAGIALIAHPTPVEGGTLDNKVVHTLAKTLFGLSYAAAHPELGLTLSDDLWPEERFFFRSDHFNFARKEVPAIFFFSGVHADYHRPSDQVEKIDTGKAARIARMVFYIANDVANDPQRPRWDPKGLEEVRRMTR